MRANPVTILYLSTSRTDRLAMVRALREAVDNPIVPLATREGLDEYLAMHRRALLAILIDVELDGGPFGIDVIRAVRQAYPERSETPIFAVLPAADEVVEVDEHGAGAVARAGQVVADRATLERAATAAGASVLVTKPVTFEELVIPLGRPGWYRLELVGEAAPRPVPAVGHRAAS